MREPIYYEELQDMKVETVELPEVKGPLADTETSYSFNASFRQQKPIDLSAYGYVEEEFLISGYSHVYEYHDVGPEPKVRCDNGHYTTRIFVRRPADVSKQSDFAILEIFNYAGAERGFACWGNDYEYLMQRGDVWVGISIKQSALSKLLNFDPVRYAGVGFPNPVPKDKRRPAVDIAGRQLPPEATEFEDGLGYDAMSQAAALLKADDKRNPLYAKPAKYVIGTGASGCDMSLYAAAIQNFATTDGVHPCFDGIHIHMTGYPGRISNGEKRFDADDPRCKIATNVPLVWTQTMGDMRGGGSHPSYSYMYRWPDSDEPGKQHRQYEIAAAGLGTPFDRGCTPHPDDIEKYSGMKLRWEDLTLKGHFPIHYVTRAVLDALKRWIKDGIPAPPSQYLEMEGEYPDADFVLDEFGNPKGGVRSPYVDVPVRTYTWVDDRPRPYCDLTEFTDEQLKALYPSKWDYIEKVMASATKMAQAGFLLPEDIPELLHEAEDFAVERL